MLKIFQPIFIKVYYNAGLRELAKKPVVILKEHIYFASMGSHT